MTFEHFKPNYRCHEQQHLTIQITVIMDNDFTHYFDNYFGFQTNLIIFFSNKLFMSKTRTLKRCFLCFKKLFSKTAFKNKNQTNLSVFYVPHIFHNKIKTKKQAYSLCFPRSCFSEKKKKVFKNIKQTCFHSKLNSLIKCSSKEKKE